MQLKIRNLLSREEIKDKVLFSIESVYCLKTNRDDILENDRLGKDLGMDSLDILDVAMDLEEKLSIRINDEDIYIWKTVGDIIDCICGCKNIGE